MICSDICKSLLHYFRLLYVRNASGLIRDSARLLHILLVLVIVVWWSNRTITGFIIYNSKFKGSLVLSRNFCMKTVTNVTTDRFHITHPTDSMHNIHAIIINGFLYDVVLFTCYFTAIKTRYDNMTHIEYCFITPTFCTKEKIWYF